MLSYHYTLFTYAHLYGIVHNNHQEIYLSPLYITYLVCVMHELPGTVGLGTSNVDMWHQIVGHHW